MLRHLALQKCVVNSGKKLASIAPPGLNKALFTVCGATAIDNAIAGQTVHRQA